MFFWMSFSPAHCMTQKATRPQIKIAADGASVPVPVEVGESVKFKDYAGADIRLDGEDYIVVRVPDCLAKWTE